MADQDGRRRGAGTGRDAPADEATDPTTDGTTDGTTAAEADVATDGGLTFETIDWDAVEGDGQGIGFSTVLFGMLCVGIVVGFVYDALFVPAAYALVGSFQPTPLDWMVVLAASFLLSYVVVPLVREPARGADILAAVRARRFGRTSLVVLTGIVLTASLGPEVIGTPTSMTIPFVEPLPRPPTSGLAPIGFGVPADTVIYCSGEVKQGMCYGTIRHPLGTTASGRDVLAYVIGGFRVALNVAVVTSVLLVPLATVAGATAAYYGGRVDAVVSRLSDFMQVVPVFVIYLFVRLLWGSKLWLLILLFGLLGWGQIARQVRAEALSLRDVGYVRAAREAGASRFGTVWRHLVPNVSHVAVSALALQIPKLIVVEVTLAYLGLVQVQTASWGYAIVSGIKDPRLPIETLGIVSPLRLWWTIVFPMLALLLTVATLTVLVGALGDALDPREVQR